MTYIPDPLFRNGLEHYRKTAPASVWDRVEAGLDRKRRRSIWLKVAAGLALLMATSVSLLLREKSDPIIETVSITTTAPALKPVEPIAESHQLSAISYQSPFISYQPSAISHQSSLVENLELSQSSSIVERSRNNHADVVQKDLPVVERSRNEPRRSSLQSAAVAELSHMDEGKQVEASAVSRQQLVVSNPKSVISSEEAQLITLIESEEIITELTSLNTIEGSDKDVIVEQKGTSITYTAEQVNTRFIKKELPTQATPAKKNASGLQKVIDKAVELTTDGTVYGELREKKNEWLSLNMLSNKTEANK